MPNAFRTAVSAICCCALFFCAAANASLFDDVAYTTLQQTLGGLLPTGMSTTIDEVEAPIVDTLDYLPDATDPDLVNITITDVSMLSGGGVSGHATSVARQLGGPSQSLLSALDAIDAYEANDWLERVLNLSAPDYPLIGTGLLANHSWVGELLDANDTRDVAATLNALHRMDWLIEQTGYLHVVGAVRNKPLFAFAMNVIAVTKTDNTTALGTTALDDIYAASRAYPHIVAPRGSPSGATATVSSAAGLLRELAMPMPIQPVLSKAILMAGAARETTNTQSGDIVDYGTEPTQNGLDYRYGAGQLDIFSSYEILSGGVQEAGGELLARGFNYETGFGGAGEIDSYSFSTGAAAGRIAASLAWNVDIRSSGRNFNPTAELYDLRLELWDTSLPNAELVTSSDSTVDNTENVWTALAPYRNYELRVSHNETSPFSWPYALAWRIDGWDANGGPAAAPRQIPALPPIFLAALFFAAVGAGVSRSVRPSAK